MDTIKLKTSTNTENTITWKGKTQAIQLSNRHLDKLYFFLDSIAINSIDSNEIIELSQAMINVNYGPKSGFCEGQTKYIEVIQRK